MAISRIQIAKPALLHYFDGEPKKLFKPTELAEVLSRQRAYWNLAKSTGFKDFVKFLSEEGSLKVHDFPFPYRHETRYAWGKIPLLEILMSLKARSYFTHLTAMELHQLANHQGSDIYFNHEQRPQPPGSGLEQGRIDAAFKRKARESNNIVDQEGLRVHLLNSKYTDQLGVTNILANFRNEAVRVRVTNIERTLIDAVVRPTYAGGVPTILAAFHKARGKVDIPLLFTTLQKLNHLYPYHQAIGYCLEESGYPEPEIALFRKPAIEFDFYLTYQMKTPRYVERWRLYVPQ